MRPNEPARRRAPFTHARTRARRAAAATLLLAAIPLLQACVGYANYPPIEGDTAVNDPNASPFASVIVAALDYTIERHPIDAPYAVNLPEGMLRKRALQIIQRLDDPDANPMTPETQTLPTYHVSRIWIRGAEAEVDVHRPLPVLFDPGRPVTHQTATLYLKSGFNQWRVERVRPYAIGAFPPPPPNIIPERDGPPPANTQQEPETDAPQNEAEEVSDVGEAGDDYDLRSGAADEPPF